MLKPTLSLLLLSLIAVTANPAFADEKPKPAAEGKAVEKAEKTEKTEKVQKPEQGVDEAAREKKRQLQEQRMKEARGGEERRNEELGRMKQELVALREKAQHPETPEEARGELKREIQQLEQRLKQAAGERPAVKKAEAGKPEKKPELTPELREQAERLEMAARRVKHVRTAAENLMAAEMPDMAHELMQRAEGMERELAVAKEQLMHRAHAGQGEPRDERGPQREAEALRDENRALQNELRELRGLVEKLRAEGGR